VTAPLTSVSAVRRHLHEAKAALERDIWSCGTWDAFQSISGQYRQVTLLLEELGIEGAEHDDDK
jgi:hypothetical protein